MSLLGHHHFRSGLVNFHPPIPSRETPSTGRTHTLDCPYCGEAVRVPFHATNARCTTCQKPLILEDIVIRGDSIRTRIVTCGLILVEPSARFSGFLQGSEIVIAGRVMGTVIGTKRVEVTATGKVAGSIATRHLASHDCSLLDGQINILNPDNSVSTFATGPDHHPPHALSVA